MNILNISETNRNEVLKTIILSRTLLSRADISRIIGLNKASVSRIINELIDDKIVYELKKGDSTIKGGKKPLLINVNSKNILIGIYILKNNYHYLFTDVKGRKLKSGIYNPDPADKFLKNIENFFIFIRKEIQQFTPIACNIVIPGIVDSQQIKIIYSGEFDINDLAIRDIIKKYCKFPIFLENDANAAAAGYKFFENNTASDFIFILLRIDKIKSILYSGCGIVLNNKLIKGKNNFAGEFLLFNTDIDKTIILYDDKWELKTKYENELLDKITNNAFFLNPSSIIISNDIKNNTNNFLEKIKINIEKVKDTYKGFETKIIISSTGKISLHGSIAILIDKIINSEINL